MNQYAEGVFFAVLAGVCASLASVFGKLSFDSTIVLNTIHSVSVYFYGNDEILERMVLIIQGICFSFMLLVNLVMMNSFAKSMNKTSSLYATVISNSINYCFSGILGFLLFREILSWIWCIGASLILFGLYFMMRGIENQKSPPSMTKMKKFL